MNRNLTLAKRKRSALRANLTKREAKERARSSERGDATEEGTKSFANAEMQLERLVRIGSLTIYPNTKINTIITTIYRADIIQCTAE